MSNQASGFSVRVSVECFTLSGVPDTQSYWFGVTNAETMRQVANGCVDSVFEYTERLDAIKYGDPNE